MPRCHDAARKETMNSHELTRSMDTGGAVVMPRSASCGWKAPTWETSEAYDTVRGSGREGMMTAVEAGLPWMAVCRVRDMASVAVEFLFPLLAGFDSNVDNELR